MDYIYDFYSIQSANSKQIPAYILSSLYELYEILQNSSTSFNQYGFIENGIMTNCSRQSPATEYMEYVVGIYYVICIIIFSTMVKRISYKKDHCNGKPGLVLAMNMLNSHDYAVEYTLIFLSLSEEIYGYIFGAKSEFGSFIPVVKFFIKLLIVIIFSIVSYPVFAAVTNRNLFGYTALMFASIAYFSIGISATYTYCYCLVGIKIIPFLFAAVIYSYIDLSIVGMFIWKIVKHLKKNQCVNKEIKFSLKDDGEFSKEYVKELFKKEMMKSPNSESLTKDKRSDSVHFLINNLKCDELKSKMKEKIYQSIPGFRFPPRLIIGMFVGLYLAYRIFIDNILFLTPTAWNLIKILNNKYLTTELNISRSFFLIWSNYSLYTNYEIQNAYRYLTFFYTHLFITCFLIAAFIAFINSAIQSFLLLRNYRLHFHKITKKGFSSMIDIKRAPEPYSLILGFVRFSGYQAAFTLWGILVLTFFMFALLYFLIGVFLMPLFYVENSWSRRLLINYGPVLIASIVFNFIQTQIVKYMFVMEKGKLMEVNNRKAFMIFTHCAFFLNAMMGLFNSVKRVLIWIFSGAFCFSRIDFSSLPEYLHGFDNGYMCYVGFIYTEQYHYNPILKCFADILLDTNNDTDKKNNYLQLEKANIEKGRCRFRNLWHLSVTLINNHQLLLERKDFIKKKIILN